MIEEVENLDRSEFRAAARQRRRIALHILKEQASPASAPVAEWQESILAACSELVSLPKSDPGLRPRLGARTVESARALKLAVAALQAHGEDAAGACLRQRTSQLHADEQILGHSLPERLVAP